MSKIGILGGTFNPIHKGHIQMAGYAKTALELDKILFIPTCTPPHKDNRELACEYDRLNMCKLACKACDGYEVSEIEIKRKGKSYTYETLIELKELYKDDTLYLIVGADMFLSLDRWKNPEVIFDNAIIVAIPRNENDADDLNKYYNAVIKGMGAKAFILTQPLMQVSSTFIRDNIADYNVVSKCLDENVYDYIVKNNLYRK